MLRGTFTRKKEPAESPAPEGNWAEAAARLKLETSPKDVGSPPNSGAQRAPWTVQEEGTGARAARRIGRGLLWLVVGLAAVTGVREWIYPNTQAPPAKSAPAARSAFPTDEAQAVAARFATAYLTWDEEDPELRAALLAPDLPEGADTAVGWDGKGQQQVISVQSGRVTVTGAKAARVQVTALVKSTAKPTGKATSPGTAPQTPRWTALDVPLALTAGRVLVSGTPGLVGVPVSGPEVRIPAGAESDIDLANATRPTVERFFTSYAAGDISAELAPGSALPALPAGTAFQASQSWTVDAGSGDDRHGTATVVWRLAGAQLTQTYRVKLTRVSASDAQRWQVSDVRGGRA